MGPCLACGSRSRSSPLRAARGLSEGAATRGFWESRWFCFRERHRFGAGSALASRGHGRIDWARSLALRGDFLGGAVDGLFFEIGCGGFAGVEVDVWDWWMGSGSWGGLRLVVGEGGGGAH